MNEPPPDATILDATLAYGQAMFDLASALESGANGDQAAARRSVDETLETLRALLNHNGDVQDFNAVFGVIERARFERLLALADGATRWREWDGTTWESEATSQRPFWLAVDALQNGDLDPLP